MPGKVLASTRKRQRRGRGEKKNPFWLKLREGDLLHLKGRATNVSREAEERQGRTLVLRRRKKKSTTTNGGRENRTKEGKV